MKRKLTAKIVTLAMAVMMLVTGFSTKSFAANVCKQISGSSKAAQTFNINTGSRWYSSKDVLKLTQTKGTMKIMKLTGKNSTKKMYEKYYVKVEKLKNNKVVSVKNYTWQKSSLKLKLDKNSTYRVTVTPAAVRDKYSFKAGTMFNPYGNGITYIFWAPRGWKKHSTWKVSSTSGILSCK